MCEKLYWSENQCLIRKNIGNFLASLLSRYNYNKKFTVEFLQETAGAEEGSLHVRATDESRNPRSQEKETQTFTARNAI